MLAEAFVHFITDAISYKVALIAMHKWQISMQLSCRQKIPANLLR